MNKPTDMNTSNAPVQPAILTGRCLCGAIRYSMMGPPEFVMQCYCRDCQKATGTGHTTIVGLYDHNLKIQGDPATFTVRGESGGRVTRHFCRICGGRLYTSGDLPGPMRMIQAGSLDDPNWVTPTAAVYVKDAICWDRIDSHVKRFDKLYPLDRLPQDV
jgi:hypothetical protein